MLIEYSEFVVLICLASYIPFYTIKIYLVLNKILFRKLKFSLG